MRRIHAFEFTDLSWWPDYFRVLLTDFLRMLLIVFKPFDIKNSEISKAISNSKHNNVIDLCSGTSGPWLDLYENIQNQLGNDFNLFLTDKFPKQKQDNLLQSNQNITKIVESVDATKVPSQLKGVRTLFNGFHHFSDEQASDILKDAIDNDEPIFIFEILQRSWIDICVLSFLTPVFVLFLTPLVRPFRWSRLFWTYIIPLAPAIIFWDTLVSNLRCYNKEELISMAKTVDVNNRFNWHVGEYRKGLVPVTYMYSTK